MITDCYDPGTEPIVQFSSFYGEQKHILKKCLILFSGKLQEFLLEHYSCRQIARIIGAAGEIPVYALEKDGQQIAFYLSLPGSAAASGMCCEVNWLTGADTFVMFGSCGSLAPEQTAGHFIIPTESWRGEGAAYYYAPPADFIRIKTCPLTAAWFEKRGIPYVTGRVWTTDSMLRETAGMVAKRRAEGCIAVEMELAGVQAVCDFYGMTLYNFLEAGDVLAESGYDVSGFDAANHDTAKLLIALELAAGL